MALVELAKNGDVNAYEALVHHYQELAFRVAYQVTGNAADAEDAAQEAFVNAYYALGRFRPGAPFKPWLCRIVVIYVEVAGQGQSEPLRVAANTQIWEHGGVTYRIESGLSKADAFRIAASLPQKRRCRRRMVSGSHSRRLATHGRHRRRSARQLRVGVSRSQPARSRPSCIPVPDGRAERRCRAEWGACAPATVPIGWRHRRRGAWRSP